MFNVCLRCGEYRADKIVSIGPGGARARCPVCGYEQPFRALPLFIVSGASGTGKTTLCNLVAGKTNKAVVLDTDILWQEEFNSPEDRYRRFFETWLRTAKNIAQSGRPVVLFGAGLGTPENIEPCIEGRYFSALRYVALYCRGEVLEERLKQRPPWRGSAGGDFIKAQLKYNEWFRERGPAQKPPIDLLDTTAASPEESAAALIRRIEGALTNFFTIKYTSDNT